MKARNVFRYRKTCFSELQSTTVTQKAVAFYIFPLSMYKANKGVAVVAVVVERRSQKSTLLAICWDTPAQLQSDESVRVTFCSFHFGKSCHRRL